MAAGDSKARAPGLDVLRGVAIALVILRHSWPAIFGGGGIVGVAIFFTLSGYLITGVLLTEYHRGDSVNFSKFYRNRAIRLWPALLSMLAIFLVVEAVTNRLADRHTLLSSFISGALYVSDIPIGPALSPGIGHLWTLAIEEQFYLLWPFLLVFAMRKRAVGVFLMITCAALALLCAGTVVVERHNIIKLYTIPTSWAITLVVGGAACLYRDRLIRSPFARPVAAVVGLLVLAVLTVPDMKSNALTYLIGGPLIAVSTVAVILQLGQWRALPAALRPIRILGIISYAAYLWNYVISNWLHGPQAHPLNQTRAIVAIPLTLVAATASWWIVERPFAAWRRRLDAKSRSDSSLEASPNAVGSPEPGGRPAIATH